jgi:dimeric dUTPase (all-alpha-NTP-PPase superfamily)
MGFYQWFVDKGPVIFLEMVVVVTIELYVKLRPVRIDWMTFIYFILGIVFNIFILVLTFKRKLIKKDYRMLYYMFITLGDLFFAINCLFVGINIAFK